MTIQLRDYGHSFATRQRATELLALFPDDASVIDVDGVACSPSFLAELLLGLANRQCRVVATDAGMLTKVERLVKQLAIGSQITIGEVAVTGR